jgi:hypothetical protein
MIHILSFGILLNKPNVIKYNPPIRLINTKDDVQHLACCYTLYDSLKCMTKQPNIIYNFTKSGFIIGLKPFPTFINEISGTNHIYQIIGGCETKKPIILDKILLFKSLDRPFFTCMNNNIVSKNAYAIRLLDIPYLWLLVSEYNLDKYENLNTNSISCIQYIELQNAFINTLPNINIKKNNLNFGNIYDI